MILLSKFYFPPSNFSKVLEISLLDACIAYLSITAESKDFLGNNLWCLCSASYYNVSCRII